MSAESGFPYYFAIGFRSLFKIMGIKRIFSSNIFKISLAVSLLIAAFLFLAKSDCHDYLIYLSDLIVDMFPNLLGFALAGYAVVISSGSQYVFDETAQKEKNEKYSLFQITNSVWGFILLANVAALLLGFIIKVCSKFSEEFGIRFSYLFAKSINVTFIFALLFASVYAILLHIRMVELIFNYGQKHLLFALGPKLTEEERRSAVSSNPKISWGWRRNKLPESPEGKR